MPAHWGWCGAREGRLRGGGGRQRLLGAVAADRRDGGGDGGGRPRTGTGAHSARGARGSGACAGVGHAPAGDRCGAPGGRGRGPRLIWVVRRRRSSPHSHVVSSRGDSCRLRCPSAAAACSRARPRRRPKPRHRAERSRCAPRLAGCLRAGFARPPTRRQPQPVTSTRAPCSARSPPPTIGPSSPCSPASPALTAIGRLSARPRHGPTWTADVRTCRPAVVGTLAAAGERGMTAAGKEGSVGYRPRPRKAGILSLAPALPPAGLTPGAGSQRSRRILQLHPPPTWG
jgi:hypothetical protein